MKRLRPSQTAIDHFPSSPKILLWDPFDPAPSSLTPKYINNAGAFSLFTPLHPHSIVYHPPSAAATITSLPPFTTTILPNRMSSSPYAVGQIPDCFLCRQEEKEADYVPEPDPPAVVITEAPGGQDASRAGSQPTSRHRRRVPGAYACACSCCRPRDAPRSRKEGD